MADSPFPCDPSDLIFRRALSGCGEAGEGFGKKGVLASAFDINEVVRQYVQQSREPLEKIIRRVIREELGRAS
jgi:hypothetical protein